MESLRRGAQEGRSTFRAYRFELGGHVLAFHAVADFGDVTPFLAEGDRVELAVQLFEDRSEQREPLVYALRNLEDDCTYVCQAKFLAGYGFGHEAKYSLPGMSLRRQTRAMRSLAFVFLVSWGGIAVSLWAAGEYDDAVSFAGLCMLGLFAAISAVLIWQRWRVRLGWPSRRQRLLSRVYATLSIGSPEKPAPRVYSV